MGGSPTPGNSAGVYGSILVLLYDLKNDAELFLEVGGPDVAYAAGVVAGEQSIDTASGGSNVWPLLAGLGFLSTFLEAGRVPR